MTTPKICTQCGAPFHGSKCAYCGTEYQDYVDEYINEHGFLHKEPLKSLSVPVFDMNVETISSSNLCAGSASIKNLECENAHF